MAARVVAVGQGVTGLHEGERVSTWAAHQQSFKARPDDLIPIPEAIGDEEATWAALACTTQLGVRRAGLCLGERVGVVGLGMLGQLVVQYLALMGARQIVAIDRVPGRLDVARAHGATHALAVDVAEARPQVAGVTAGQMLDAVLEVTGNPAALASAIQLLRRLGRVVLLGDTPTPSQQCLGPGMVSDSIAILGIHGTMSPAHPSAFNPWTREEMSGLFFEYLAQGRMRVADLITDRRSPLDAPQVYAQLLRDRYPMIGVLLDWSLI
jgi:threonine dehydrogenase-like Zn-dependent dehydrogenase